ncbi:hypothetical protein DIZ27_23190 [Streptomyces sp. NWU339]|uniref:hypothetical protein n=1 Tax=Streptomyces sp. NWU339 TaxID=2185284 RepID=UPI000D6813E0|nr:hypothetical protein [Streptomyces sp. NWU339]PWI08346.1 hypothetical protein DIZ27_23190 [Streptomyces sp. NWU339]
MTDAYALAVLALVLGLSAGWCWGHATARIRHVPIGAHPADDEAVVRGEFARFNAVLAALDFDPDLPDHPDPKDHA